MSDRRCILMRCDGAPALGLGHVVRCLALADELRLVHGCDVRFAMIGAQVALDLVHQAGYAIEQCPPEQAERRWLEQLIARLRPALLVLDLRAGLSRADVAALRSDELTIAVLDDPGERRLAADLAFYPQPALAQTLDWSGFAGRLYAGWEWALLRPGFAARPRWVMRRRPSVLLTMGGSDPAGLTLQAARALELLPDDFETIAVLGHGFVHADAWRALVPTLRHSIAERHAVADMATLLADADLAIVSFGVTAYELAALGVPAIYLCLSAEHARSAAAFVEAGLGISLGVYDSVTAEQIAAAVASELMMRRTVAPLIDGLGAQRIAAQLLGSLPRSSDRRAAGMEQADA